MVIVILLTCFFLASSASPAQTTARHYEARNSKIYQIEFNVKFSTNDLTLYKIMGYDIVQMKDSFDLNQIGKPMIPMKEIKVALPPGMKVTEVVADETAQIDIAGEYILFPAQPPRKTDGSTDDVSFVQPDPMIYTSTQPYPSKPLEFIRQSDLAGQPLAVINIYPVQYIPSDKKLTLFTSISFIIKGEDGYICGDYLSSSHSARCRETYQQMITEMVVNPKDVQLQFSPNDRPICPGLPPGGPYDHVIISSSTDASSWQPLADWHTKQGLKDIVVDTTSIYANYSGSDNPAKIRNFITDAKNNWGAIYFLLCGENSAVPFKYRTYAEESIPSDEYYSDFDDDWVCEVFVGRLTAQGATEINLSIQKVLKYEQDPPLTDYILDTTLLGMDLSTVEHDGILTRGEYLKQRIDSSYIPPRFTITEVYDTQPRDHTQDFFDALNNGQNLVNHNDHSNIGVLGVGYLNHGGLFSSADVDTLTNTNKTSNIFSIGCLANAMDDPNGHDCIAEHFVIYNNLKAGVSFTGNTRSGWFYYEDPYSLSAQLDEYWWRGLFSYKKYRLGETLAYTKNNCPLSGEIWQYCHWSLNLLGEPAMSVWTDTPKALDATYPAKIPKGTSNFTVHVQETSGEPVANASVCLWKIDDFYLKDFTDSNGNVTFTPLPSTRGTMYVTVTKQNYLPFEGTVRCSRSKPFTNNALWAALWSSIQTFDLHRIHERLWW